MKFSKKKIIICVIAFVILLTTVLIVVVSKKDSNTRSLKCDSEAIDGKNGTFSRSIQLTEDEKGLILEVIEELAYNDTAKELMPLFIHQIEAELSAYDIVDAVEYSVEEAQNFVKIKLTINYNLLKDDEYDLFEEYDYSNLSFDEIEKKLESSGLTCKEL